jgi:hypothetical protein
MKRRRKDLEARVKPGRRHCRHNVLVNGGPAKTARLERRSWPRPFHLELGA